MESETAFDDVPDESEWHAPGPDDFTACGLACCYGGTDRESEIKRGGLADVTCQQCMRIVRYFKKLR
jgi:hypothetical protein